MKLPVKPPSFHAILKTLGSSTTQLWRKQRQVDVQELTAKAQSEYWNWEDCKYRAPTVGLTQEEFWAFIKITRNSDRCRFALLDSKKTSFSYSLPDEAGRLLHEADKSLAGHVGTDVADVSNPDYRAKYIFTSLREEAFASSLIEGAVSTRSEAKEMIRTGRTPKNTSEWMILNNFNTIQYLLLNRDKPLSLELLLDIQWRLTANTIDEADAGRLRTDADQITIRDDSTGDVLHVPPPAHELPDRLQKMCDFANADSSTSKPFIHPVIRSVLLHFWLAYDHPFVDGNGRTARALFYWHMLRNGYWLAEFLSISSIIARQPKKYYRAYLDTESDDNDATYFIMYHLRVLEESVIALQRYVAKKKVEQAELAPLMNAQFNPRQESLLELAVKNPRAEFSYESHGKSHGVVIATARADILELVDLGLLNWNKKQRPHRFTPHQDILKRLQKKSKRKG